jgi:hypothetical protein
VVKQYPHTLKLTTIGSGTQDSEGNWIPGGSTEVEKPCRFETNDRGAIVATDDGAEIVYDGIIYLPLPADQIAPGTTVQVLDGVTVLSNRTVKKFSRGQLNARIWL